MISILFEDAALCSKMIMTGNNQYGELLLESFVERSGCVVKLKIIPTECRLGWGSRIEKLDSSRYYSELGGRLPLVYF